MDYRLGYFFGKILAIFLWGGIFSLIISAGIFLLSKALKKATGFKRVYKKVFIVTVPIVAILVVLGMFLRATKYI